MPRCPKRAELEKEATGWVPVLQLASVGDWRFVSDGVLYLVAPAADVAAGRLDRARVVLQR